MLRGSVTPLGALNDEERKVKVYVDASFDGKLIGMHPNENTASIWMQTNELMALLHKHGCHAEYMEL